MNLSLLNLVISLRFTLLVAAETFHNSRTLLDAASNSNLSSSDGLVNCILSTSLEVLAIDCCDRCQVWRFLLLVVVIDVVWYGLNIV